MAAAIGNIEHIVAIRAGAKAIDNSINHIIGKSYCYALSVAAKHTEDSLGVCSHIEIVELL